MFISVVPQHCKWADIIHGVGLKMVVWVVEGGCIYDMDVIEAVVVVEMDGRDSMELVIDEIEEN